MKHIRIHDLGAQDILVHAEGCFDSFTLCGLETMGDEGIDLEAGVIVKDQIDCSSCIMTIDTAKKIKESEIYRGE